MDKPKITPPEPIFENKHVAFYRAEARFPQFKKVFHVSDYGLRACVLLLKRENVLLVRQYRFLVNDLAWELPGGRIESHETPPAAAFRECLEETGIRCNKIEPLLFFHLGLDTCRNPTHIFYCSQFEEATNQALDQQEVIDSQWIPLSECIRMVFTNEIADSVTIAALLAYNALQQNPSLAFHQ